MGHLHHQNYSHRFGRRHHRHHLSFHLCRRVSCLCSVTQRSRCLSWKKRHDPRHQLLWSCSYFPILRSRCCRAGFSHGCWRPLAPKVANQPSHQQRLALDQSYKWAECSSSSGRARSSQNSLEPSLTPYPSSSLRSRLRSSYLPSKRTTCFSI